MEASLFGTHSLRHRILQIIAFFGFLLSASLVAMDLSVVIESQLQIARMRGTILAQGLAAAAENATGPDGPKILRYLKRNIERQVDVVSIDIMDPDGVILHSTDPARVGREIPTTEYAFHRGASWADINWTGPSEYTAAAPVHHTAGADGLLMLAYRSDATSKAIMTEVSKGSVVAGFWLLLIGAVAVVLTNRATRPLVRLSSAVENLPRGAFELEVEQVKVREIDILQRRFQTAGKLIREKERQNEELLASLQNRVEEASRDLRRTNQFLHSILRSMHNAIVTTDLRGVITSANDRAHQTLGVEAERLLPQAKERLQDLLPDPLRADTAIQKVMNGRVNLSYEVREEPSRVLSIDLAPFFGADDELLGCVARIADVSEQRWLEEQVQRSMRLASVGSVAAAFAHEFGNSLHVILGLLKVAARDVPTDSPLHQDLQTVIEEGTQASALVTQFKQFGRLSAGQLEHIDLADLVASATPYTDTDDPNQLIELAVDIDESTVIHGDRALLRQALMNLIKNAIDSMPGGGEVRVAVRKMPADRAAEISVSDHGTGIAPEILPRVFEPFFTTREQGGGTGLGLAIVQAIVTLHGGIIHAESALGEGTTFTIRLPLSTGSTGEPHGST